MKPREKHHIAGERVYRFVLVERIAHWVNASAFFALVFTGTLLFLRQFFHLSSVQVGWLHQVHLILGAVYFFGPALIFLVGGPIHGLASLLEAFRWTPSELLWMLGPLRRLLPRWIPSPVVGRFNAGQRLNMLVQIIGKWLLAASGLMMHLRHGQLLMYALHLLCYFIVCALAAGHIYMALINPATRHSIHAMLSGFVRADWLRHHHPGWFHKLQAGTPKPASSPDAEKPAPPQEPPPHDRPESQP